jgi:hypothetical protein
MIEHIATLPVQSREELGSKARAYILANKTWEAQAQKTVQFIDQLCN